MTDIRSLLDTQPADGSAGDGAAFVGAVGRAELEPHPDALEMLRQEHEEFGWSAEDADAYIASLDKHGPPTAYMFACRQSRRISRSRISRDGSAPPRLNLGLAGQTHRVLRSPPAP